MRRLIIFLVRKKLGLKKNELFQFKGQSSVINTYYFTSTKIMKNKKLSVVESNVSLNWLLSDECEIVKIK